MYQNDTSKKNANLVSSDKSTIWAQRYSDVAGSQKNLFDKMNEWYKMMYAIRDDRNTAGWRSKIHIPILSTKAWSLISKFVQQEPGFEVVVRSPDEDTDQDATYSDEQLEEISEKVQRKMEQDYHNPELDEPIRDKLNACLVDAVVAGTGLAKVPWVMKKKKSYAHATKGGELDYTKDAVTVETIGFNDIQPVNIFNVFVAPSATSLQNAPWIMIKEYKTLAELKSVNDASEIPIYKNLDALKDVRANSDEFAQQKKARQNLTSDQDPVIEDQTVQLIEIFECYERDSNTICTYARNGGNKSGKNESWITIREQKNPYWHGKFPLVAFYIRRKPFSFWGESLFESTERLQSAANDVFNHYMDNWNLAVDGGIMIEETSQVADFLVEPGFELVYRGEQPKQFSFPAPDPNQLTLVMNQIEKSVENATISNYAQGTPISGLDKTQGTARGTMAILEAATDMIQFMRDNFQSSIHQIGEMWLSNNRQFIDFDVSIPTLKNNKLEYQILTPDELQLQMQLRINDMAMQPISDQQKRENFVAYQDRLIQLQTASINQANITQDKNQILFIDYTVQAEQLAKQFNQKDFTKQTMTNEQALSQETAMQEQAAQLQGQQQQSEDMLNKSMIDVAELPSDDVLKKAEDVLLEARANQG